MPGGLAGAPYGMCTFGHSLPAVYRAERQDMVNNRVVLEAHGVCIVCIVEAVQDYVKRRDTPQAPAGLTNRDREDLREIRALIEQLQGEVRDAVALARSSHSASPAP